MCAYNCAKLSYTTQHRAVLIIYRLILHTNTRAQMLSIGGGGAYNDSIYMYLASTASRGKNHARTIFHLFAETPPLEQFGMRHAKLSDG